MDIIHLFENVNAYVDAALRPATSHHRDSHLPSRSWSGSDSFDRTIDRYRKGFSEGIDAARKIRLQLTPFLRTVKGIRKGWKPQRYAGGNFILDNYVKGIPEVCNVMSPIQSKKFASIILNGTASSGIETDVMFRRGIAATALVDILEAHNYRTAVKIAYAEKGANDVQLFTIVTLKTFGQSLDLDRIAFFLADPSSFRRLHFAFMESLPEPVPKDILALAYGIPIDLLPSMYDKAKDIYLTHASYYDSAWKNLANTQQWITETLRRYGIEFHGGSL